MAEVITIQKLTEIINLQYTNSNMDFSSFDIYMKSFNSFMNGGITDSMNSMMKLYKNEYDKQQHRNYEVIYDKSKDIGER